MLAEFIKPVLPNLAAALQEGSGVKARKYVVVGERVLGVLVGSSIEVLASGIECPSLLSVPLDLLKMRDATGRDFVEFRVPVPPDFEEPHKPCGEIPLDEPRTRRRKVARVRREKARPIVLVDDEELE